MDLGAVVVFLAVFAGCGAVVFFVSVLGTRTETFEEALEKQRNAKEKSKEKKKGEKKSAPEKKKKQKKGKDAKNNNTQELVEESVLVESAGQVVEPVYIEPVAPVAEPVPAPVKEIEPKEIVVEAVKPKKEEKKKKEKVVEEVVAPAQPVVEEVAVESSAEVVEAVAEVVETVAEVVEAVPEPVAVVEQPPVAKPEKKKMVIQEVAEITVEEPEEKKNKKKSNKAKKKSNYEEVLETVRRITLSDTEAQGIVDVVLMKQTGHKDDGEDWVEPGKETEAQKKSRQLADLSSQLEEEKSKSSGLEKKMLTLRKEMNDGRAQLNVVKRELEEMNTKKTQEASRFNTTIQQLKGDLNTRETYNIQMESKYQTEIRTIKEQLERASQAPAASDGHLVTENEQLKTANADLTSNNASLHHKFTQKCFEVDSLTASLTAANEEKQNLTSQLATAQEEKQALMAQLSEASQQSQAVEETQTLTTQLSQAVEEKQSLTSQLSQAVEEKQSLSSQLSLSVEEKQSLSTQLSQAVEAQNRLSEELKQALDKDVAVRSEADGNSQEAVVAVQELETKLSGAQAVQHQLQSDLTSVKEKLSDKEKENCRLLEENERLSEQVASCVERPAAEGEEAVNGHTEIEIQKEVVAVPTSNEEDWQQKYEKLNIQLEEKSNVCNSQEMELTESKEEINKLKTKNDELSSEFTEYKKECMLMLSNVLPAHCTESQDFSSIQSKANKFIQDLESAAAEASKVETLKEENTKLEAQGASYKTVLAETENILNTLQASVEGAELEWKKKLEASESECSEIKSKVSQLQSSNQQLTQQIKDQESMSSELESEKSRSDVLAKKCSELQQLIAIGEKALELAHSQDSSMTNGAEQTEEEA